MPIEVVTRANEPVPLEVCPKCGARPLVPFLRFMVARDMFSPWRALLRALGRGRPQFCVICWQCKEIVGHE